MAEYLHEVEEELRSAKEACLRRGWGGGEALRVLSYYQVYFCAQSG